MVLVYEYLEGCYKNSLPLLDRLGNDQGVLQGVSFTGRHLRNYVGNSHQIQLLTKIYLYECQSRGRCSNRESWEPCDAESTLFLIRYQLKANRCLFSLWCAMFDLSMYTKLLSSYFQFSADF